MLETPLPAGEKTRSRKSRVCNAQRSRLPYAPQGRALEKTQPGRSVPGGMSPVSEELPAGEALLNRRLGFELDMNAISPREGDSGRREVPARSGTPFALPDPQKSRRVGFVPCSTRDLLGRGLISIDLDTSYTFTRAHGKSGDSHSRRAPQPVILPEQSRKSRTAMFGRAVS